MPQVNLPDGTTLNFPDGMSESAMRDAIYSNFPQFNPNVPSGIDTGSYNPAKDSDAAYAFEQPQEVVTSARAWNGAGAGRGGIADPRRLDVQENSDRIAKDNAINRAVDKLRPINTGASEESLRGMAESAYNPESQDVELGKDQGQNTQKFMDDARQSVLDAQKRERMQQMADETPVTSALLSGVGSAAVGLANAPQALVNAPIEVIDKIGSALAGKPLDLAKLPKWAATKEAMDLFSQNMPTVAKKDVDQAWKDGDFGMMLLTNLAANSPSTALSLAAAFAPPLRAAVLPAMGAMSTGQNYANGDSAVASVIKGGIEMGTEMLPLQVFDKTKDILNAMPLPKRSEFFAVARDKLLKTGGSITANGLSNAIEEAAAQVGGNAVDIVVQNKKDTNLMDGVGKSALIGAVTGAAMSAPQMAETISAPGSQEAFVERELSNQLTQGEFVPLGNEDVHLANVNPNLAKAEPITKAPVTPEAVLSAPNDIDAIVNTAVNSVDTINTSGITETSSQATAEILGAIDGASSNIQPGVAGDGGLGTDVAAPSLDVGVGVDSAIGSTLDAGSIANTPVGADEALGTENQTPVGVRQKSPVGFEYTVQDDGTLVVHGDAKKITAAFPGDRAKPVAGGILFGKTRSEDVLSKLGVESAPITTTQTTTQESSATDKVGVRQTSPVGLDYTIDPSGSVTVHGDQAAIKQAIPGIASAPVSGGVVFGKTRSADVLAKLGSKEPTQSNVEPTNQEAEDSATESSQSIPIGVRQSSPVGFDYTLGSSGSVTVHGDPKEIKAQFPGVTSAPVTGGVVFGKTQSSDVLSGLGVDASSAANKQTEDGVEAPPAIKPSGIQRSESTGLGYEISDNGSVTVYGDKKALSTAFPKSEFTPVSAASGVIEFDSSKSSEVLSKLGVTTGEENVGTQAGNGLVEVGNGGSVGEVAGAAKPSNANLKGAWESAKSTYASKLSAAGLDQDAVNSRVADQFEDVDFDTPVPAEMQDRASKLREMVAAQTGVDPSTIHVIYDKKAANGFSFNSGDTTHTVVNFGSPDLPVFGTVWHEVNHTMHRIAERDESKGIENTTATKFVERIDNLFNEFTPEGKAAYVKEFLHKAHLAKLASDIRSNPQNASLTPEQLEAKVKTAVSREVMKLSNDSHTLEEMQSDFLGKSMTDEKFINRMAVADPIGFGKFAPKWLTYINDLISKAKSLLGVAGKNDQSRKIYEYVKDLEKAHSIVESALISLRPAVQMSEGTDGTVSFKGDQESIEKALRGAGVEKITVGKEGVTVGKTEAPYAKDLYDSGVMQSARQPVDRRVSGGRRFVSVDEFEGGPDNTDELGAFDLDRKYASQNTDDIDLDELIGKPDAEEQAAIQAELNPTLAPAVTVTKEDMAEHGLFPERAFEFGEPVVTESTIKIETPPDIDPYKLTKVGENQYNIGIANGENDDWFTNGSLYTKDVAVNLYKAHLIRGLIHRSGYDIASAYKKGTALKIASAWLELAKARNASKTGRTSSATNVIQVAKDLDAFAGYSFEADGRDIRNTQLRFKDKSTGASFGAYTHLADPTEDNGFAINTMGLKGSKVDSSVYAVVAQWARNNGETFFCDGYISAVNTFRRTEQAFSFAIKSGDSGVLLPGDQNRVYGFKQNPVTEEDHKMNIARLALAGMRNMMELWPDTTLPANGSHTVKYDPATGEFRNELGEKTMIGLTRLTYVPDTAKFLDQSGRDVTKGILNWIADKNNRGTGVGEATVARAVLTNNIIMGKVDVDEVDAFAKPVAYQKRQIDVLEVEDAKGTAEKSAYTKEQKAAALKQKFKRMREFHQDRDKLVAQIDRDADAGKEEAVVLRLIARTGFRIGGGVTDGKPTYAATTLKSSHVKVRGDTVSFDFIGKAGVRQRHDITDPKIAKDIRARLGREKLFNTTDRSVRRYKDSLDGGAYYKVHDFRTWVATNAAQRVVDDLPQPESKGEYYAYTEFALSEAATKIGDTFDTTKEHYVDPQIFEQWRKSAGITAESEGEVGDREGEDQFAEAGDGTADEGADEQAVRGKEGEVSYSRKQIVGQTDRQYTPEQLRAFDNVGFRTDKLTIKERTQALMQDAGKKMAQGIADQFMPVAEFDKKAYGLMRLSKGASGAFETLLQGGKLKLTDNVYDFDAENRGGVVDKLLLPLQGEHHDFFRWVAANRAERLSAEDRENLFTADDIAAIKSLADGSTKFDYTIQNGPMAGTVTRNRATIYKDAAKTFDAFNRNVMDMAEQSGLIDPEARAIWEHEFYVPFYRVSDEDGFGGARVKSGVVRQQAFKTLKGGKDKLNTDLLDNTLMNWAYLLDASAKNRAAKAALEAAVDMGIAIEASETIARQMGKSIGNKSGVVWAMDEGKQRFFLVDDPYVLEALNGLEYAGLRGPIMDVMSAMKHWLTVGVTASPYFKIRNLARDSIQAISVGELSYNPVKNIAEGFKLSNPESDQHFRMLAGGGTIHFATMYEGSEARRVQALVEAGVKDFTILNDPIKVKAFYRKFIEPGITAYNELGNRGEEINRAALYNQLIKQGVSHADASLQARDLMDFSMQGTFKTIRFLTQVVPFMNARIQGMYKLGKGAKENPARFAAVTGAVALASLALLAAYHDDDDWKQREEWDRNNYWWFKFGGIAFRIPKPFEVGAIGTLAERGFEWMFDKEMTNKRFMTQVKTLLADNLSMNPIPQVVKPILDIYSNRDSFSGREIENSAMEKLDPKYRFNQNSSMAARGASNAMSKVVGSSALSPLQIDHLVRGYFGWLGTFVVSSGDLIARPINGEPVKPTPDYWKVATGGIVADKDSGQSRYVSQMYEQAKELEQAYATYHDLLKKGKQDEAKAYREENSEKLKLYGRAEGVKKNVGALNERIRVIERSNKTADEKRDAIQKIKEQQDKQAKQLVPH